MEKYSRAISEMYLQFEQREAHPLEKYIGRLAKCCGEELEVVGYAVGTPGDCLIADAAPFGNWRNLGADDVVFKRCESYCYVGIDDLID